MQPQITQFGTFVQWQDQWNADTLCELIENFILETDQVSPAQTIPGVSGNLVQGSTHYRVSLFL
jgi:hypothetical protein